MQTTIGKPVETSGVGLHTGCHVSLRILPAPAGTGIVFRRTDLQGFEIEATRNHVSRVVLATTLMKRGVMLSTVEHLLSALYGLGVDNAYLDIDSLEVPILDGSARPFVEMIREAGIKELEAPRIYLQVIRPVAIERGDKFIRIEPWPRFTIEYAIDFPHPVIGRQQLELDITPEVYGRELSFARTFGFHAEVEELLQAGLIRGGSLENAVVLDENGVMSGALRAPDEFVRHKVLDLIGDISLCGLPLVGKITAYRAGHALHTDLATHLSRDSRVCRKVTETQLEESLEKHQQPAGRGPGENKQGALQGALSAVSASRL